MSLDRFRLHRASPDYLFLTLAAILVVFGLVMISSASVVVAMNNYGQSYAYVLRQAGALVIGVIGLIIASRIRYDKWRQWALPLFSLAVLLLLIVFIPGIGKSSNGASRWINLGVFQLQPSELLKIATVIFFAAWLEKRGAALKSFWTGLLPFAILLVPIVVLLVLQHDMGTMLVIVLTSGAMFFVAGAPVGQIITAIAGGAGLMGLLIVIEPYRLQRLTTFLHPATADKLSSGYQINQSLIAVGSGGWFGRGFGNSLQKYLYLPEPHTDSIFAITVEELGFFRATLLIVVIGFFVYRGYQIAAKAADTFARLVAFGLVTMFLVQSAINIAVIINLVPFTGVPLPFISYGGTSLVVSLAAVGIILNVSKYSYGQ